jgi:predicted transcriptional regulator
MPTAPADDPLHQSRLDALRAAVMVGLASAQAGRLVDGRVVEHELREELDHKLEQRARRKAPGRRGA